MARLASLIVLLALLLPATAARAGGEPVAIVAAENFYADIARQIGGTDVAVQSILSNPDQDPHLFEVSPSVGRAVAAAHIVIYNGIDYDPWMQKLLQAAPRSGRQIVVVADLLGRKPGDNPHIWYDPATMPALAKALAAALSAEDPADKPAYEQRLARFEASMQPIVAKVATLRQRLAGTPVTATEPVMGEMLAALGLQVRNMPFQVAVMNDTEPAASDVAAFESDLQARRVQLLVYNSQASSALAARMQRLARESHVPVIGATETEPSGLTYQTWMMGVLDAVNRALPP